MTVMQLERLKSNFRNQGIDVEFAINNNRRTFLSASWDENKVKVSLHNIFLKAPEDIFFALEQFIGNKKDNSLNKIKAFVEEESHSLDYSSRVKEHNLRHQGTVYNVKKIYDELNERYFEGAHKSFISWYGKKNQKNSFHTSLGLYYDTLRLIKVHRLLDREEVPQEVIEYVVYHEMLHAVCKPFVNEKGEVRAHTAEFKAKERNFHHFQEAEEWIKYNKMSFFKDGRTQQVGEH